FPSISSRTALGETPKAACETQAAPIGEKRNQRERTRLACWFWRLAKIHQQEPTRLTRRASETHVLNAFANASGRVVPPAQILIDENSSRHRAFYPSSSICESLIRSKVLSVRSSCNRSDLS